MLRNTCPHRRRYIFESPISEILVDQARILVGLTDSVPLNLRVDMPVDLHDVLPAIVIDVNEPTAPRNILIVNADTRRERNITKGSVAVVVIEVAGVVREVRLEDVEPPVAVVVRYSHTHTRLFVAVLAIGATRNYCNIGEGAVVIVVK